MVPGQSRASRARACTRHRLRCLLYLTIQVVAGWLTWIALSTVLLFPLWAVNWARVERRLVTLTGRPALTEPARARSGPWREIAHSLVIAAVSVVFTVAAIGLVAVARSLPPTAVVLLSAAVILTVTWAAAWLAVALASLTTVLLSPGTEELQAQVDHLVEASMRAQDQLLLERRLLQQQLHDGAQLQLSIAGVRLGLLECDLAQLPDDTRRAQLLTALDDVRTGLDAATDAIRDTARGLMPRLLLEEGIGPALRDLTRQLPLAVRCVGTSPRLGPEQEAGLYLIASEAVTNVVKHAHAGTLTVELDVDEENVAMVIRDDGVGGAAPTGSGLLGMTARARRLGGRLELSSPPGGPTAVTVRLPRQESP